MTATPSYQLIVGSAEIAAADVMRASIFREAGDFRRRLSIGQGTFQFDNENGAYSPEAANCSLQINQKIQLNAVTVGNSVYNLFTGYIENISINPEIGARVAVVNANDVAGRLLDKKVTPFAYEATNVASVVSDVLSAGLASASDFSVDACTDNLVNVWYERSLVGDLLSSAIESGAHYVTVKGDGVMRFVDRNYFMDVTAQSSLHDEFFGFSYQLSKNLVLNDIEIGGQVRDRATAVQTIAVREDRMTVPASSSVTFWIDFEDPNTNETPCPANSLQTLANSQHFALTEMFDWSSRAATVAFYGWPENYFYRWDKAYPFGSASIIEQGAAGARIEVFNGYGSPAYLQYFNIQGFPWSLSGNVSEVTQQDSSVAVYGDRQFTLYSSMVQERNHAQIYGDYLIDRWANPVAEISFQQKNLFPQMLEIDLLDHVTVTNTNASITASEFAVIGLTHDIFFQRGTEHQVAYTVALAQKESYLILDADPEGRADGTRVLAM